MQTSDIKALQLQLKQMGLYNKSVTGKRDNYMDKVIKHALRDRSDSLPKNWKGWDDKRKAVALLQLFCQEKGIDSGKIDGYYGPQTEYAADRFRILIKGDELPPVFADIHPIRANPHEFPLETEASLNSYYGTVCQIDREIVTCPWTLRLDWDLSTTTNSIGIHSQLADSLNRILTSAISIYGEDGIKDHGLDRYGGSYNCRYKRGSNSSWSTHAWAIALDWYPSRNKLSWRSDRASLAHPDLVPWWELWEAEGWVSLGRSENRDWMHVQAAVR